MPLSSALDEHRLVKRAKVFSGPTWRLASRRFSGSTPAPAIDRSHSKSIIAALARLIDAPEKIADLFKVIVAQIKARHATRCGVTGRAAVRLTSSRGIAPKQTHVIERSLYCFLELSALYFLQRSGIAHRSPVLLDDRR
jgi:hypothetical protein